MGKFVPNTDLDLVLDRIALSNQEVILTQDPQSFFACVFPELHLLNNTYTAGEVVRQGTDNGFVYECVVGGLSGATEPGWSTTQDEEFTDNAVTWKAHANYALANADLVSGDFSKSDVTGGRKLTIGQKGNLLVHRTGVPEVAAFINLTTQTLHAYTGTRTAIIVNNQIVYPDISQRSHTYEFGDRVFASEVSSTYYECLIPGLSGISAPTWGTLQDQQFVDGEVTWRTHIASSELSSGTLVDFLSVEFTNVVV